jgi:hypothetical protein
MAPSRAIPRIVAGLSAMSLAACAVGVAQGQAEFQRIPREIRIGAADMAIVRVEQDVSRAEVAEAVQRLVSEAPMCFPWPGVWLDAVDNRRNVYFARYDLMARDWGADVAEASRTRMQEFVDLGFLLARPRPDIGADVVQYTLTVDGAAYLQGSPYGGERPSFCAPSERRLVDIVDMQWGDYACGSLHVRFTHVADQWPSWARTGGARERIASTWAPLGELAEGSVTLARQWFRRSQPRAGGRNGALNSVCFDASRQQITGDDLQLSPPRT